MKINFGVENLEVKNYLIFVTALFFLSIGVGVIFAYVYPLSSSLLSTLPQLAEPLKDLTSFEFMLFIFMNNTFKSFLAITLGILLGIYPLLLVVGNGYLLGRLFYDVCLDRGIYFVLACLIPHGILEIPAVLLSCALGVKLGYLFCKRYAKKPVPDLRTELMKCMRIFLFLILPLLLIGSFVEVWITPIFIGS